MTRWLLLFALAMVSAGCRAPGNVYAPYGSTCVPPPGTGAVGAPYYQAPASAAPYGGYPAGTVPGYPAGTVPGYPAGAVPGYPAGTVPGYPASPAQGSTSSMIVPGGPQFAVSPYMINDGAWSSSAPAPAIATAAPPTSSIRSQSEAPIQPRPSGQLIASGARFSRNENLDWGNTRPASSAAPYAASANAVPSIATASYDGPVRPSVVRPGVIYDPPIEAVAPIYYPNDYVLDPYASTYDPYVSQPVGNLATAKSGWAPR